MNNTTSTKLSSAILDNVWRSWLLNTSDETHDTRFINQWRYQRETRRTIRSQEFEEWLYEYGFMVVQENKARHLVFFGSKPKLTLFLLTHNFNNC